MKIDGVPVLHTSNTHYKTLVISIYYINTGIDKYTNAKIRESRNRHVYMDIWFITKLALLRRERNIFSAVIKLVISIEKNTLTEFLCLPHRTQLQVDHRWKAKNKHFERKYENIFIYSVEGNIFKIRKIVKREKRDIFDLVILCLCVYKLWIYIIKCSWKVVIKKIKYIYQAIKGKMIFSVRIPKTMTHLKYFIKAVNN